MSAKYPKIEPNIKPHPCHKFVIMDENDVDALNIIFRYKYNKPYTHAITNRGPNNIDIDDMNTLNLFFPIFPFISIGLGLRGGDGIGDNNEELKSEGYFSCFKEISEHVSQSSLVVIFL